jgi:hypothetical protein
VALKGPISGAERPGNEDAKGRKNKLKKRGILRGKRT